MVSFWARVRRQILARMTLSGVSDTLAALGLCSLVVLSACAKSTDSSPMNGADGANAQTPAQAEDPTYKPNPQFEEWVKKSRNHELPKEKPSGATPAPINFDEPVYVGESPFEEQEEEEVTESETPAVVAPRTSQPPARPTVPTTAPTVQTPKELPGAVYPVPVSPSGNSRIGGPPAAPVTAPISTAQPPPQRVEAIGPNSRIGSPPPAAPRPTPQGPPIPQFQSGTVGNQRIGRPSSAPPNLYRAGECKNLIYVSGAQAWCKVDKGRLYDAVKLEDGPGFRVQPNQDGKQFTTFEVEEAFRWVGDAYRRTFQKNSLIGQCAQKNGGPIMKRVNGRLVPVHLSHQNGLDCDVGLPRINEEREPSRANTDLRAFWWMLNTYNSTGRVHHFFVSAEMKSILCREFPNDVLQSKISRWEGHTGHFHIRFRCPENGGAHCIDEPAYNGGIDCPAPRTNSTRRT